MGPEPGKRTQDALEGRPDTPTPDPKSPAFSRRSVVTTAATFAALAAVGFDLSRSSSAYAAQRFIWPFPLTMVHREFGLRDLAANRNHLGIDFGRDVANREGTPVISAAAGVVVAAQTANKDYNCWKKIDHGDGLVTRYHMMGTLRGSGIGQHVEQGATIGTVGPKWGTGTGPHLHFQTEVNGIPINPRDFMNIYNNNTGNGNTEDEMNPAQEAKLNAIYDALFLTSPISPGTTGGSQLPGGVLRSLSALYDANFLTTPTTYGTPGGTLKTLASITQNLGIPSS